MPQSADFKRADGSPTAAPPQLALATDTVRYVGEAVAAVIADTVQQARDALEAIEVDYEPLPMVVATKDALAAGAPLVWNDAAGNVAAEMRHGDAKAADTAFARAAHRISIELVNQRVIACPVEPRATLVTHDAATGRTTLRVSCQTPTGLRDEMAGVLGVKPEELRVVVGDVGGGFGMKTSLYSEDVVATYAARKARPAGQVHRRSQRRVPRREPRPRPRDARGARARCERQDPRAPDRFGRQRRRVRNASRCRHPAADRTVGVDQHLRHRHDRLPDARGAVQQLADRTVSRRRTARRRSTSSSGCSTPRRGRPASIAVELRRRNMIQPSQLPYKNQMQRTYDSGHFEGILDKGMALADWNGFDARRKASKARASCAAGGSRRSSSGPASTSSTRRSASRSMPMERSRSSPRRRGWGRA
jgi:carbon-monoxide dehydrogenase large subunit